MALDENDLEVRIGRCIGGSFIHLLHIPSGVSRYKGPLGKVNKQKLIESWKKEIEEELKAKELGQYLLPKPINNQRKKQSQ